MKKEQQKMGAGVAAQGRERSTPPPNEGDSEEVMELHSTEPWGGHISLFSDREN